MHPAERSATASKPSAPGGMPSSKAFALRASVLGFRAKLYLIIVPNAVSVTVCLHAL